ncbi:TIGR02206 family membrane protein [Brevibacillus ginsengisoli]|uniref:YwaF family protein n=1 Tax=Brevibacillus ginsengisoli TaxID=363854 RepID=UPI003CF98C52
MELRFFSYELTGEPFRLFSLPHLVALAVCLAVSILIYLFRKRLQETITDRLVRYILAGLLLLTEIFFQLWHLWTGYWSSAYTLPLQLCSVSLLFSIWMLLTNSYRLFEITYFIGLGGAASAMFTPELFYPFPHVRFFHFFIAHAAIIWASLYMTWVKQYQPTLVSIWKTMGLLNGLLVVALIVNKGTGGNYMFVSHKPGNPSLIDYLGPYPWYILSLEVVAVVIFFLLYLPFVISRMFKPLKSSKSSEHSLDI